MTPILRLITRIANCDNNGFDERPCAVESVFGHVFSRFQRDAVLERFEGGSRLCGSSKSRHRGLLFLESGQK